ncbi:MAG TPA: hypothetical protein VN922_00105, partial [Bacteroidia bacterium]|nr:hypothetical protein [Bacteroidia bacterium]
YYGRATGLETWFTLPDLKTIVAPPKWKMAIASFIGAYCISSLVTLLLSLNPYIRQSPYLFNTIMTTILVVGLTYFAMPILSRLLRRWLYPSIEQLQNNYKCYSRLGSKIVMVDYVISKDLSVHYSISD